LLDQPHVWATLEALAAAVAEHRQLNRRQIHQVRDDAIEKRWSDFAPQRHGLGRGGVAGAEKLRRILRRVEAELATGAEELRLVADLMHPVENIG
jgi:hypothetical protein